jgi:hypothetical protein
MGVKGRVNGRILMMLTVFGTWNLYALILQRFLQHALNEMHRTFHQGD